MFFHLSGFLIVSHKAVKLLNLLLQYSLYSRYHVFVVFFWFCEF